MFPFFSIWASDWQGGIDLFGGQDFRAGCFPTLRAGGLFSSPFCEVGAILIVSGFAFRLGSEVEDAVTGLALTNYSHRRTVSL